MNLLKLKKRKEILAWSFYDFANQPFSTIIVTFIYSTFFIKVIADNEEVGTVLWANSIAITAIIVSVLSPLLGVIADASGTRKFFLFFFTLMSSICTALLYFPNEGDVFMALLLFIIANICFEIATVFYNSYLPDLSDSKNSGRVSGFAWGLGFFGGLTALFLSYMLFPDLDFFSVKKINILVGAWFIFFSMPAFIFLKAEKKTFAKKQILLPFSAIKETFRNVLDYSSIAQFLVARLFFNDGLVTIFALGGIYAVGTLGFTFDEVMILAIALNLSAGIGSFLFGYMEDRIGVKLVINISLIVLIFSTLLAFIAPYFSVKKEIFWIAGIFIGLMVGPNQSCSRSLMSQLTPKDKKNEFFGFFALTGKFTSFLGPFLFGLITSIYNQQMALWVVILFFVIGLILFNKIEFNDK